MTYRQAGVAALPLGAGLALCALRGIRQPIYTCALCATLHYTRHAAERLTFMPSSPGGPCGTTPLSVHLAHTHPLCTVSLGGSFETIQFSLNIVIPDY